MRLISCLALLVCTISGFAETIKTPAQLISAMHDRYARSWYHTLTFEQDSITHAPEGSLTTERWHEALMLPGHLRIDVGEPKDENGMLFVADRLYVYRNGKLASDRNYIHPLLVLGFDVYAQPPEKTLLQLKDMQFNLDSMHEDLFEGRPMYVVGASNIDVKSPQFWIDKEFLYLVRKIGPDAKNPSFTQEVRFEDYKRVAGGGWVAEHVEVLVGRQLVFEEKYSDVQVNPKLDPAMFDPQHFFFPSRTLLPNSDFS